MERRITKNQKNKNFSLDTIKGYVERLTYHSEETGFTVAKLQEPSKSELTSIIGYFPDLQAGESIRCVGHWKNNPKFGRQFEVSQYHIEAPSHVEGIQKYLGSGLIKGIGPVYSQRIVSKFGQETLDIMDNEPDRLSEVDGIGKQRLERIKDCWSKQRSIREVMIFLQQFNVNPSYAKKIFKTYQDQAIAKITENPYTLARDIIGIGFKTADKIAQAMGISRTSHRRIDACIEFALGELSREGHTCYPLTSFLEKTSDMFELETTQIAPRCDHLVFENRIIIDTIQTQQTSIEMIWLKSLYMCEIGLVKQLQRIKDGICHLPPIHSQKAIPWIESQLTIALAQSQRLAIKQSLDEKVHIITGIPGTGKSTITKVIITLFSQVTSQIILAAPTGRAAKRLFEITGKQAKTIHSLLSYNFKKGGFTKNEENPLDCDLIIIDEASMIDTQLMYHLLKAIPSHAHVIFVGDIYQLPSIGAGSVLKDLIKSQAISCIELTDIYRQAALSHIITNAQKINHGVLPNINNDPQSDFFFIHQEDTHKAKDTIVELVTQRLPKKYGFNSILDIQVLSPMKRGIIGSDHLNEALQHAFNPNKKPLIRSGRSFVVGDKVMQIQNNYRKDVFNGDVGMIEAIDWAEQTITVSMDQTNITYDFSELDELSLSYSVSIHKFQGSECPCIIIPIHQTHYMMLSRNLLYTGVTRGKKLVVLIGSPKALAIAVRNNKVLKRYSGLGHFILKSV